MSTPTPPAPPPAPAMPPASIQTVQQEIRIVSHSMLFYWWPVWVVGLLLTLLTFFDGHGLVVVPSGSKAYRSVKIELPGETSLDSREAILVPPGKHLLPSDKDANGQLLPPKEPLRIASSASFGVVFAVTLLLVITITNVPLRGLWSVIVIIFIVLISVIFALAGWWDNILNAFSLLDIRINMGGYLFISLVLLGIWGIVTFIFDRQVYMIFTPGQFKVCLDVGGGETSYDTIGMVIQKQRDDLFRHWILGMGSGDLVVRTSGAQTHEFHLPNVLFIGKKLQMIEEMQRTKPEIRA